jgi:hypothetical protein
MAHRVRRVAFVERTSVVRLGTTVSIATRLEVDVFAKRFVFTIDLDAQLRRQASAGPNQLRCKAAFFSIQNEKS